jgi:GT2 family glycosyltransferase
MNNCPKVAIIILNWNGWRDTIECLETLQRITYPNYQVIVVDNGSKDDSVEKIKAWAREKLGKDHVLVEYTRETALKGGEEDPEEALEMALPKVRMALIRNEENLGFTGGNNVAIHYALNKKNPADYVFLLNNDARPDKNSLINLVSVGQKLNAGIIGALLMNKPCGRIQFIRSTSFLRVFFPTIIPLPLQVPKTENEFWPSFRVNGSAMLIHSSLLDAVFEYRGFYLNSQLFAYADEADFCFVSHKLGYKCFISARAIVYHKEGSSAGGKYNPMSCYYHTRNRVLLANNLLPLHWRTLFHIVNLPLCFGRILKHGLYRRPNACFAMLSGFIDGYRGVTGKWKHHDKVVFN